MGVGWIGRGSRRSVIAKWIVVSGLWKDCFEQFRIVADRVCEPPEPGSRAFRKCLGRCHIANGPKVIPSRRVNLAQILTYGWLPANPSKSASVASLASELLFGWPYLSEYFSNTTMCSTGCRSSMGSTIPFCCNGWR